MAREEAKDSFEPLESRTMRYDLDWLHKAKLERKIPTLLVLRGADAGRRIPLSKDSVSLGRTVDADLVFHDEQISRRHAMISRDPVTNIYSLSDLGSTNGTFLNDRPVKKCEIKDGDKIFIGTTILKFVLQDEVESESGEIVDRLMFQDDLTGLVVKRRFYNDLRTQLHLAASQGLALSILMMDMDGLKKVNDTHGHDAGGFIISEVGKIIGAICNKKGQACRYGGDEFVAYLLETQKPEALRVGEEIRQSIRKGSFRKGDVELKVSISIGVACFPDAGATVEELNKAADDALYRAKAKGRDTVSD